MSHDNMFYIKMIEAIRKSNRQNFSKKELKNESFRERMKSLLVNSHKVPWEEFYDQLVFDEAYYEFIYNDSILSIGSECFGNTYVLENEEGIIENKRFLSSVELIKNVRINGKSLKKIWDELR